MEAKLTSKLELMLTFVPQTQTPTRPVGVEHIFTLKNISHQKNTSIHQEARPSNSETLIHIGCQKGNSCPLPSFFL